MENNTKKKSNFQLIIIILLALLLIFFVIDKIHQKKKTEEIITQLEESNTEKQNISNEMKELLMQYDELKTNNDTINAKLAAEQKRIKQLIDELKYVKSSNSAKIKQYKKELGTLRKIMRSYIVQIDSLYTRNQELIKENAQVKNEYRIVISENQELSSARDSLEGTVRKASELKALNLVATGINKRGKKTNRISKLDKIKVCFTIDENVIAPRGEKWVYIRIAKPDKYVLHESESDLFTFEGKEIAYSAKRVVNYQGDITDMCIYWKKNENLIPGLYYVDVFADGYLIGTTAFTLN
jgi:predicted  nucleic acid-binding Zn-ribbon protein